MRRHVILAAAALTAAAFPTAASAQEPPPATAPATAPVKAGGHIKVVPERVGRASSVLAGARWRIRAVSEPYVEGQRAIVRIYRGGRRVFAREVALQRSRTGASGYAVVGYSTMTPGKLTVRATKPETAGQVTLVANPKTVTVLPLRARPGSTGRVVRVLQQRLRALGYVTGAPGVYDARTARAVLAFRKVSGMARTSVADSAFFRRLVSGGGRFRVRYPSHGRHIEADLSRQVMALIGAGGRVERIYPVSSGSPVTPTVRGQFRVYRRDPGTNALGMVHSSYFIRGYAIHGYKSVPVYPASHGCLRVPVPDALSIFRWVRMGTRVDVYP